MPGVAYLRVQRRFMNNEEIATNRKQSNRVVGAYLIYAGFFTLTLGFVSWWLEGTVLHEHIARNWMLCLVMVSMPANNNKLPFWKSVMISFPVMFLVLGAQTYLAYSVYGYDPTGSINMWAAGGSILMILGSGFMSWFIAKQYHRAFTVFGAAAK